MQQRRAFWAGARDGIPVVVGVVPFGLVFGAAAADAGLGLVHVSGFSAGIFAGASQLASVDLLDEGAPTGVAVGTAIVINLRMLLYSASLSPWWRNEPAHRRIPAAYLLTDQAFAVSVARYEADEATPRVPYYAGVALLLWAVWQVTTLAGALTGDLLPDDVPLDFAVPLVFLSLLVPTVTDRPALVAAIVAGAAATTAHDLPANLGMLVGAVSGIAAGTAAASRREIRSEPTA